MDDPLATMAPPDPTWNPPNTVSPDAMVAAPPDPSAATAPAPPVEAVPQNFSALVPSETAPNNPDIERQYHESTWRRILDKVGGILGGDQTLHVRKDADGNVTVTHDPSTGGEKWGRVAATALGGAAQGLANSQGPGGAARAAAAGTQFGLQQPQQRQQEADAQATAEQRRQQMNANNAMIHQRAYAQMLDSQGKKLELDQQSASLMNDFRDEMVNSPDSQDFGVITSEKDLMDKVSQNVDFLKNHMNLKTKAALVPGKNGLELHAIATDPGDDAQPIEAGAKLHVIKTDPVSGKPTLTFESPSKGTKKGTLRVANSAVDVQFAGLMNNYQKAQDDKAKADREKVPTTYEGAVIQKYKSKYPDDPERAMDEATAEIKAAEQRRFAAPTININNAPGITQPGTQITEIIKPGARFGPGTIEGTNAQSLASGDQTIEQFPKKPGKGMATPQEYFAAAEAYSRQLYGLGYSPTMIDAEKKQFTNIKEQGVLNGIDRMIGVGGEPGYLDKVVTLGKAAGVGPNAPINEISLALKKRFGETAASNFNTALGEVQRSLPQLIGNPLLGGSDTDLKLKQAQDMFGRHPTAANLDSTASTLRDLMQGALHSYSRNNRFFQRRYGMQGAYAAQYSPTQAGAAPGANPDQAARQPGAPAPTKDRSIAAAMALPINNGKSKADVEADLKKFGYNPVP